MSHKDKKVEKLARLAADSENTIVYAVNLDFLSNEEIEVYEEKRILLFLGYRDEITCSECIKGSCTVPIKRADYPDGRKMAIYMCPDPDHRGRFEIELDKLRYWKINTAKLIEFGFPTGYEVLWDIDNVLYIPLKDAANMANSDLLTLRKLSKLLEDPEFPVHRMHNGRRCRVHMPEFRKWLEYTQYGISDAAIEKYLKGAKARQEAVLQKKKRRK